MMTEETKKATWELDLFRPEDAPGVVGLYRSLYGDNYPAREVYDPETIIKQCENGDCYRAIAREQGGRVVGQSAFYRSAPPNPQLYEFGQLMVDHAYRQTRMAFQLLKYSLQTIPSRFELKYLWGEAICNHIFTQQASSKNNFCETALEVDLMPGESYSQALEEERANKGRVSAVISFKTFTQGEVPVYLPKEYEAALHIIYDGTDFQRTFIPTKVDFPLESATESDLKVFPEAGVARLTLNTTGADLEVRLVEIETKVSADGVVVVQVYLRLNEPWVGAAVAILRRRGYFLGGALPYWFGEDGLLMQKTLLKPNFHGMMLYSDRAKALLELIKADWLAVSQAGERD